MKIDALFAKLHAGFGEICDGRHEQISGLAYTSKRASAVPGLVRADVIPLRVNVDLGARCQFFETICCERSCL